MSSTTVFTECADHYSDHRYLINSHMSDNNTHQQPHSYNDLVSQSLLSMES